MAQKILKHCARALSFALHPYVLPIYWMTLLLTQTSLARLSLEVREVLIHCVVCFAVIVPSMLVAFLYTTCEIFHKKLPKMRMVALVIALVCYCKGVYELHAWPAIEFLYKYMLGSAYGILFCLVVSLECKISVYMTAMGGFVALLLVLNILGVSQLFPWLIGCILATGLLASARLYLGAHHPKQMLVGFLGGFVIMLIALLFL